MTYKQYLSELNDINSIITNNPTVVILKPTFIKQYCRSYFNKNKQKIIKRLRDFKIANKLQLTELNLTYYERHKDELKIKHKEWYEKNKQKIISKELNKYHSNRETILNKRRKKYNNKKSQQKSKNNFYKNNPDKFTDARLRRDYGITLEQYNQMLKEQGYVCKICGEPETKRHFKSGKLMLLSVDHCHTTGKIRGTICARCNLMLGKVKDDVKILSSAIDYLNHFKNN